MANQVLSTADILKFFGTGMTFATILGWVISHFSARSRDKKNDSDRLINNAHGLLSSLSFLLGMQYSELVNIKKQIESRISILKKLPITNLDRESLVSAVQNFTFDDELSINVDALGVLMSQLRTYQPNLRGCAEIMQSCYISNKHYQNIIKYLSDFNDMKQSISKNEDFINTLTSFSSDYFPVYLEQIDKDLPFIKRTHDSLETLFELLGKKGPKIDKIIEL